MDQLNIGVTVDATSAPESLTKVSASIDKIDASAARMAVSQDQAARMIARTEAESRKFLASLKEEAESYGKSRDALLAYRASQLGVATEAKAFIDHIKEMKAANLAGGAEEGARGMDHLNFATAGARRELLVLAHEASQGNWTRFGGSLMVLGERTDAMSLIFSRAGLAVGATAAAVGSFAVAAVLGANESRRLADTMQVTNGMAGITASRFNDMASIISIKTGASISTARTALQELTATGQFSGNQMLLVGQAAVRMSHLTGQSTEDIVQDFGKMTDGVAKWAAEHNRSMHFMTADTYAQVVALEEQGKKTDAIALVSQAYYDQVKEDATRVGTLERAWRGVTNALSSVWDTMKSAGRDKTSTMVDDQITAIQTRLNAQRRGGAFSVTDDEQSGRRGTAIIGERTRLIQQLGALEDQRHKQQLAAEVKSANDIKNQHAIEAQDLLKHLRDETDGYARAAKEINEFRKKIVEPLKGTKQEISPEEQSRLEAGIRKRYDRTDTKADNTFQDRLRALQDEGVKLDSQVEQWKKYGKAMDESKAAILEWDVVHDRILSKLPEEKKAQLIAQARVDDEKAAVLVAIESKKTIEDKIRAIQAEASVQGIAKEATLQALLMKDLDSIKTRISKDDYDHLAASIRSSTAALEEKTATDAIKAQEGKTADEIKRIQQEADLIGKSALERQKLVEQLKIEAEARKEIAKYPDQALAIQASAVKQVEEMNSALDAAHARLVSFDTGAAGAFKDYADNAANAAESARKLVTDSLTAMDDALLQFAKTGKLSFSSLVDSIMTDMDRMMIHALETKFFQTIGDSLGGSSDLGSIVGHIGNFLGGPQAPAPLVDVIPKLVSGNRASGGSADANSLYQVNENGPELLNYGGKDYLMMGGQEGYVTPVSSSGGSSRPTVININQSIPSTVDSRTRGQIATDAGSAVRRAMARNT